MIKNNYFSTAPDGTWTVCVPVDNGDIYDSYLPSVGDTVMVDKKNGDSVDVQLTADMFPVFTKNEVSDYPRVIALRFDFVTVVERRGGNIAPSSIPRQFFTGPIINDYDKRYSDDTPESEDYSIIQFHDSHDREYETQADYEYDHDAEGNHYSDNLAYPDGDPRYYDQWQ